MEEENNNVLGIKLRRCYAKSNEKMRLGIYATEEIEMLKCVTLTTALGSVTKSGRSRNEWRRLQLDLSHLKQWLLNEGYVIEYCLCCEVAPENGLLHLHGFFRLLTYVDSAKFHDVLSEGWQACHGAYVVWVQDVYNEKGAMKYMVKHSLKNYLRADIKRKRLLVSRHWLPSGWSKALKMMKRWGCSVVDWLPEDGEEVSDLYYEKEFVFDKWGVVNDLERRWCKGEEIILQSREYILMLWGTRIYQAEINDEEI